MDAFVTPVLLVVAVGLISAVLLTIAAKVFAVPVNETAVKVRECLPGANCGACGFAGCDDYAAALAENPELPTNKCVPGGDTAAAAIAAALGTEVMDVEEMVANVRCSGISDCTSTEMDYQGYKSCDAVKGFFGGPGKCKFGCIGLGDCVKVCAYDAIEVCNGAARVNRDKCVGCGMCAKTCPQKIIDLLPLTRRVKVDCSSHDPGKITKDLCSAGCIGCKLCEKTCKFDAIHVIDNVAVIDVEKCKNCGMCAKKCPKGIIHVVPKAGTAPIAKTFDKPQYHDDPEEAYPPEEQAKVEAMKAEAPAEAPAEKTEA